MSKNVYDASSGKLIKVGGTHVSQQTAPRPQPQGMRVSTVQRPQSMPAAPAGNRQSYPQPSSGTHNNQQTPRYQPPPPGTYQKRQHSLDIDITDGNINGEKYDDIHDAYDKNESRMKIRIE